MAEGLAFVLGVTVGSMSMLGLLIALLALVTRE